MKKHSFVAGMLTMALIGSLGVGALAASGAMTITVDPVNVQVNGQTFQPKDVNGNDVPVFAYQGTTYAPLRALAEAYGLEVGYDAEANMATVGATQAPDNTAAPADYSDWSKEEEAAYQEFKGLWNEVAVETDIGFNGGARHVAALRYIGDDSQESLTAKMDKSAMDKIYTRMLSELLDDQHTESLIIFFYGDPAISTDILRITNQNGQLTKI